MPGSSETCSGLLGILKGKSQSKDRGSRPALIIGHPKPILYEENQLRMERRGVENLGRNRDSISTTFDSRPQPRSGSLSKEQKIRNRAQDEWDAVSYRQFAHASA